MNKVVSLKFPKDYWRLQIPEEGWRVQQLKYYDYINNHNEDNHPSTSININIFPLVYILWLLVIQNIK